MERFPEPLQAIRRWELQMVAHLRQECDNALGKNSEMLELPGLNLLRFLSRLVSVGHLLRDVVEPRLEQPLHEACPRFAKLDALFMEVCLDCRIRRRGERPDGVE